jgi:hypothetical protein
MSNDQFILRRALMALAEDYLEEVEENIEPEALVSDYIKMAEEWEADGI